MQTNHHRLATLALSLALAVPASATVMRAEQLNIYRDGSSADWLQGNNRLLGDAFDNDNPLVGPAFSTTGNAATYTLLGATSPAAATETGGQLLLDPNLGAVAFNAQGQSGNSVRLRLQTNISDPNGGLRINRSFAATLRLSLSGAPDPGQTFGLRLNDNGIGSSNNDVVELFWAGTNNTIIFRKQNFDAGAITVLGTASLAAPTNAAMLVLSLSHAADSSQISGSYSFADASGALVSSFQSIGNTATAFQGELYTRVELRASGLSAPVPEPGTWAMLAGGLALLGGVKRGARRRSAPQA